MKHTLTLIIALLLAPWAVLGESLPEAGVLIADGKARGVIYLAPGATPTAQYAAEELRDHLKLATGVELPITNALPEDAATSVVLVGPSAVADARGVSAKGLGLEEHRLVSGENWLVLLGDDVTNKQGTPFMSLSSFPGTTVRNGTLLAVYRFLEDSVGIRWYMPGEFGVVAPATKRVVIPRLNITAKPALEYRAHGFANKRLGSLPPADGDLARWCIRAGYGRAVSTFINHSFLLLTQKNRETLRQTKPQIFAVLPDGRRDFDVTSYGEGNLCLSEPDTLTEFVNELRRQLDRDSNLRAVSVCPNDVWIPCSCDRCLARIEPPELREQLRKGLGIRTERGTARLSLSPELTETFRAAAGRLLAEFHVKVAREIQLSHPGREVGAFGDYEGYGKSDYYTEIADLPPNLAFCFTKTRSDFWNEQYRQSVCERVRGFRAITPNLYAWEYYMWQLRPWSKRPMLKGYPVFFPQLLQDDVRFMHEQGLRGEYVASTEMVLNEPGVTHLTAYLTGKLLFDPSLSVASLLEDYYAKFYGAAQVEMKAFWTLAEACWMRDTSGLDARAQADAIERVLYPPADLRTFFNLLERAKEKVAPGSAEYQRIALIEKEMSVHRNRLSAEAPVAQQFNSTAIFPAPALDGKFGDHWSRAFITPAANGPGAADSAVRLKVAHDPQNVYFTFRAITAGVEKNADAAGFRLIIQPDPGAKKVLTLTIRASGRSTNTRRGTDGAEEAWNSQSRVAVQTTAEGWTCTVAVPWDSFGLKLHPGMQINLRIAGLNEEKETFIWPAGAGMEGNLERFGVIHFLEE